MKAKFKGLLSTVVIAGFLAGGSMSFAGPLSKEAKASARAEKFGSSSLAPSSSSLPKMPLRYTVNYASGCDSSGYGGTVISIINRRPYRDLSSLAAWNFVMVKFYNADGEFAGEVGPLDMPGKIDPSFNNPIAVVGTSYEWDINSYALFPWIDWAASASGFSCEGYYGYAEIYASRPNIQVGAWAVSGTGNVTPLPVQKKRQATKGGH